MAKEEKKKKKIPEGQRDPAKAVHKKVSGAARSEVEVIQAKTETRRKFGGAAGEGLSAREALEKSKAQAPSARIDEFSPTREALPTPTPEPTFAERAIERGRVNLENQIAGIQTELAQESTGVIDDVNKWRLEIKLENLQKKLGGDTILAGALPIGIPAGVVGSMGIEPTLGMKLTKVSKANQVGNSAGFAPVVGEAAKSYATNSKVAMLTSRLLQSKGLIIPAAAGLMTAIGTYPFSGFIQEEALQTLGFATRTAVNNGDIEGEDAAIQEQEEILDPSAWVEILQAIPFVNVLASLEQFYKAARIKLENDKKDRDKRRAELA